MIWNGVPWFDQGGNVVNAHGACIVRKGDVYYLFGEYKTNDENRYNGFSCYSTYDFEDWRFEGMALSPDAGGLLGPGRIGERVKVVRSASTGKYVMLMHTDNLTYSDPCIGVAVCDTINGSYTFAGPLLYRGEKIRKWDMGTFVDEDGTAYLLTHEGNIYRLNAECTEAEELVAEEIAPGGESPAMCRHQGKYYIMFSNKTSWERNDNYYLTAETIAGPWTAKGLFCPRGSLTYNTQCSYIFDCKTENGTAKMYLGDRWSYPRQASSATLVMLPLEFEDEELRISRYMQAWHTADLGEWQEPEIQPFEFRSDIEGESAQVAFDVCGADTVSDLDSASASGNGEYDSISIAGSGEYDSTPASGNKVYDPVSGGRVCLFGAATDEGGYCRVEVKDKEGEIVNEAVIDFYSAVPMKGVRYVSPRLKSGEYVLSVTVLGEGGEWFKKDGTRFGSKGCLVDFYGYAMEMNREAVPLR